MRTRPIVLTALVLAAAGTAKGQLTQNITYIGQQTFPAPAPVFGGTTIGGLSGIAYEASTNRFLAISDDRSAAGPSPRVYTMGIDLSDGQLSAGDVTFTGVQQLFRPDGSGFANNSTDPEGIALASNGDLWISSEGDNNPANIQQPFVNRFTRSTGVQNLALAVPSKFQSSTSATLGIRNNLAFETLTITPSGNSLFTATENALKQDGPAAAVGVGSPNRILRYDLNSNLAAQEYVYVTDPVAQAPNPVGGFATNGLVDMLAINDTTFLALERSFSIGAPGAGGTGNIIKLFEVSIAGATDVSSFESLGLAGPYAAASKTLLLDLSTLGIPLDNIEGLTFGPNLPNGQRSLILVSDNNFSGTQFTQFIGFGVTVIPAPGSMALLALAGITAGRRRR